MKECTQKDNKQESCKTPQKTKSSKRRILAFILLGVLCVLILLTAIDLYVSNFTLRVTEYSLESDKISSSIRVVQISDLHTKSFGKNNQKLIEKVKAENPHLIVLTGDIIEDEDPTEYLRNLLTNLTRIAPVYLCIGNHELNSPCLETFMKVMDECGAILLDDAYTDIEINGESIRIGALSYYRSWDEGHHQYLMDFCDTQNYTLLLCHYPEYYIWGVSKYPIDLMLSGHTHAGMIRLPFAGGLIAPEQGWFPEYDKGLFDEGNTTLIISAGLASSPSYIPRVNNPPEIVSVEIN